MRHENFGVGLLRFYVFVRSWQPCIHGSFHSREKTRVLQMKYILLPLNMH